MTGGERKNGTVRKEGEGGGALIDFVSVVMAMMQYQNQQQRKQTNKQQKEEEWEEEEEEKGGGQAGRWIVVSLLFLFFLSLHSIAFCRMDSQPWLVLHF